MLRLRRRPELKTLFEGCHETNEAYYDFLTKTDEALNEETSHSGVDPWADIFTAISAEKPDPPVIVIMPSEKKKSATDTPAAALRSGRKAAEPAGAAMSRTRNPPLDPGTVVLVSGVDWDSKVADKPIVEKTEAIVLSTGNGFVRVRLSDSGRIKHVRMARLAVVSVPPGIAYTAYSSLLPDTALLKETLKGASQEIDPDLCNWACCDVCDAWRDVGEHTLCSIVIAVALKRAAAKQKGLHRSNFNLVR